jgi:hypothetical protein
MKTVFIGGSRRLTRINDVIRGRLDAIVEGDLAVIVGDANGADRTVQAFLADRHYPNVTVYHSGRQSRNNVGAWPAKPVEAKSAKKDFAFYAAKDRAMADAADYGFMLWDGESKGTLNNIFNLLELGKKVVVYFSPQGQCTTIVGRDDLRPLLDKCSKEARSTFESRTLKESALVQTQHQATFI